MKITISNPENFEQTKAAMKKAGYDNLHILADFDRTLTYGTINGVKTPSIISLLRDGHHLSEGYAEKAHALFDKYHSIETDINIPMEERKSAMQEWWGKHNRLLIESGLSWSDLEDISQNGHVVFREGVVEFLDFLHEKNIPLVILSASGCGDAIRLFFKKIGKDYPNIYYVVNLLDWDENGRAIGIRGKIIHSMNKAETILREIPEVYEVIKDRKNVILLGDSIGDVGMIEGFDYDHLLKIGFLNFDYDQWMTEYQKNFDLILEGDKDFKAVNDLIHNWEK